MPTPVADAREFLEWYAAELGRFQRAATQAGELVQSILEAGNVDIHAVQSREKSSDSLREKLLRKAYRKPKQQITDLVGVRIITLYESEVDRAAALFTSQLKIHKQRSIDKRKTLKFGEFGYRSIHLIARLKGTKRKNAHYPDLHGLWFEIQIRSLLEHSWAEIEHEVVYKSGTDFGEHGRRRFASIAGTLELLDREFSSLREEQDGLITNALERIRAGDLEALLDFCSLQAVLENDFPGGLSFRRALNEGHPFPPSIGNGLALALRHSGTETVAELSTYLSTQPVGRALESYAASEGRSPETLSHLAIASVALGLRDRDTLSVYFPELSAVHALEIALRDP